MAVKLSGTPIANAGNPLVAFDGVWSTDPIGGNCWFDGTYTTIKDISWIGLDFGSMDEFVIAQIKYCTRGQPPTKSPNSFRFQIDQNGAWVDVHTFNAGPGGVSTNNPTVNTVDIPTYNIYSNKVRIIANANVGTGYGLVMGELEFWGDSKEMGTSPRVSTPVILSTMPAALTRGFR